MRQDNNYKLGNFEIGLETALVMLAIRLRSWYIIRNDDKNKKQPAFPTPTFLLMIVNKKPVHSLNQHYIVASPDIWHWKIGYIRLPGLYKLEKEYLKVRLWGKKMSQYHHYVLSKIPQQILWVLPTNKAIQPFYQAFNDWLAIKEGWDSYQGNRAVIYWVIVVICEATRMVMIYFIQSLKKDEKLLLMQDCVTWLTFWYNLKVKIIWSYNRMKYIKTKEWYNNGGIFFKLSGSDTHVQNSVVEKFEQLIIKKVCAMRLSANLLYKL